MAESALLVVSKVLAVPARRVVRQSDPTEESRQAAGSVERMVERRRAARRLDQMVERSPEVK